MKKKELEEEGCKNELKMFLDDVYHQQALRIDANFVSYYDNIDKKYYYYVEKLIGIKVQFE